jgi:hypothetical protein
MNFEDMQAAWKEQYPAKAGAQAAPLDAKLLERIQRNQRGFARTMALVIAGLVLAVGLLVAAITFYATLGPRTPARVIYEANLFFGTLVALIAGLMFVLMRRAPGMYSVRADRSGLSLADRIHRDSRRYRFGQNLGDATQVLVSLLQMTLVIVIDSRFGLHGPLRWIAPGMVAVPVLAVLVDRWSNGSFRPWLGQGLPEVLALSIRQTQSRARRAEQGWWQLALSLAGFFLGMKPLWFDGGVFRPSMWALLGLCVAMPPMVRAGTKRMLRSLLRPRLEELEELRAGLTDGVQPGGPASAER